ncbi:MAG: phosphoribosylanthranilate isomerase [Deltaproteobacteria bacterium]|nr:phosphoribosylanthranilate isomerase [Deltaproteobacteria bacterium]
MSVKVKICGITNEQDALDAIDLGADFLGFNFYPDSPWHLHPEKLREFIDEIPYNIKKAGVFVNAQPRFVIDVVTDLNLDYMQFNGDESAGYCNQFGRPYIRAITPTSVDDLLALKEYDADFFLVETFINTSDGAGMITNWDLARQAAVQHKKPIFLSGGLDPKNIETAIITVKPYGIDITSGVEFAPGKKDYRQMEVFIKKAKSIML